ncbi:MAG: hypothetical protein E7Z93_06225 [Cyanobacteria bacterium SIG32]|nr:hypothetical protein [Cyanobacteria bacterium SIG32]
MVIEAISSVRNNGLSQVNFEARKNKKTAPVTNPTPSATLKAVPLAVLLAMSPMTTTNAESILRGENVIETTQVDQSQNKPVVIFTEKIVTQSGLPVFVNGINSKGGTTSIDRIELSAPKNDKGIMETFTVNSVVDRELYILSYNGVKEGPLKITQVTATSQDSDKKYSFIDPALTGYVKALVEHPYNKSDIKKGSRTDNMMIFLESFYIPSEEEISYIPTTVNKTDKANFGKPIPSLTREVKGSHGIYTIRFYERPNKPDKMNLTIQKKGEDEFRVGNVDKYNIDIIGLDASLKTGVVTRIGLFGNKGDLFSSITDDLLGDELLKTREKYNYPYSHDKINGKYYLEP